jgi:predicted DNA repair protein MutK
LVGKILIQALPIVIKSLAFIGTIALLLVAGDFRAQNGMVASHSRGTSIVGEFISGLVMES